VVEILLQLLILILMTTAVGVIRTHTIHQLNMGTLTNTWNTLVLLSWLDYVDKDSNANSSTGKYGERDLPDYSNRNFIERGFTVGIGG
jgi:hypothetical protein